MKQAENEPSVHHIAFEAQPRFSGIIRRILTSFAQEPGRFRVPVPPTGLMYLNALIEGRVEVDFGDGDRIDAPPLYIGGQIFRKTLAATIETPLLLVGIEFEATGFHRLFRVDAATLTDQLTPLKTIAASTADRIRREAFGLDDSEKIAEVIQNGLAERLEEVNGESLAQRATLEIETRGGRVTMSELAARLSVSKRQLRRAFTVEVGVPPKAYAKTMQFNEVIAALQSESEATMGDVALKHGYYDQSHFVRDFTRLVGSNPSQFLASEDPFLGVFLGRQ